MISPTWFQREAVDSVFNYFSSGKNGNPLIGLPTGSGKSIVISFLIKIAMQSWPNQRIVMLTHVKELISQNAKRLQQVWPNAPIGIFSSGLKQYDIVQPIIYGGIQSLYDKMGALGHRDLLIVDEAHLMGDAETAMYSTAINKLKEINPNLVVVGLSATLYRLGMGMLTNGGIFTDVCYDMTDMRGFNRLIAEGYLVPLFPKKTETEFNLNGVSLNAGEFNKKELERAVDKLDLSRKILNEFVSHGENRHKWMIFASGIQHAEHINDLLNNEYNIPSVVVHSKIKSEEKAKRLNAYETDEARCIVNNNVLTVGYDHPPIDYIGMMRSTMSPGLWVQMAGRGTRISPETGKVDCLLMDFAGNAKRLGPINDPKIPNKKGEGGGDAPVRICPECGIYNHASARECYACGHEFTFQQKLAESARTDEIIRSETPVIESFNVKRVLYSRHVAKREGAKPCLRAEYISGMHGFVEFVNFDAPGIAGHNARDWWRLRMPFEPPKPSNCGQFSCATDAALSCSSQFRQPKLIRVHINTKYPRVLSVEF